MLPFRHFQQMDFLRRKMTEVESRKRSLSDTCNTHSRSWQSCLVPFDMWLPLVTIRTDRWAITDTGKSTRAAARFSLQAGAQLLGKGPPG